MHRLPNGRHVAGDQIGGARVGGGQLGSTPFRGFAGLFAKPEDFDITSERVTFAGFTPLDELLQDIDVVLTHGGAGTTLGSLAAGIPLVVVPQGADQFIQADRVSAAGAGLAVTSPDPGSVADAVRSVLDDPSFRENARKVGAQIAALTSPADVASQLAAALED